MQRRDFLQWMSVGAAGSLPLFVFGCRKDDDSATGAAADEPKLGLPAALQHARQVGKPLLVLAIPDDRDARWEREQDFGRWLNYADDAMLADLALVEVVCASTAELRAAAVAGSSDAAWMHLIATDGDAFAARAIEVVPATVREDDPWMSEIDAPCRGRIRAVHDPFRAALRPSNRSESFAARTPSEESALALTAKRRLRERAPDGSRWAVQLACGVEIEGETEPTDPDAPLFPCGMSMIEVHTERFLHFLTRDPN